MSYSGAETCGGPTVLEDGPVTRILSYGPGLPDESEMRLCGDPAGKRALELGVSNSLNALALAEAGAKAMAIDADPHRIASLRRAADDVGLRVECHEGDLADLGWATSASVDLVVAAGTLGQVDDLARVLRQVHRVLKPEAPLVISAAHPAQPLNVVDPATPYGDAIRSIADWYMALYRANFRVDNLQEVFDRSTASRVPSTLFFRARKLGV